MADKESTSIEGACYHRREQQLHIQFKGGRTYAYFDVPRKTGEEFLKAESQGRAFNELIKDKFEYVEVDPRVLVA